MAKNGILRRGARVELLEGQIIDMSPIGPLHGGVATEIAQIFTMLARGRYITRVQNPIRLDDHSEPEPDIAIVKSTGDFYKSAHPAPDAVLLLIEVAESSLDYDREKKLPVYGRAGIPETWIVNLDERTIEIYREPQFTGYASKAILSAGEARPIAFPDVSLNIQALLG